MNTEHHDHHTTDRPIGYWLRTVDALLNDALATAFQGEGIDRRDWMLLKTLSRDVQLPGMTERLARKGHRVQRLAERGWVTQDADGAWTLTDEGRTATDRLGTVVDGIRERVSGAVPTEDFATTMASLEAIARELGWDENAPLHRGRHGRGRGFGRRHGFDPRFGDGFGPGTAPGFGDGFGPGHGAHELHARRALHAKRVLKAQRVIRAEVALPDESGFEAELVLTVKPVLRAKRALKAKRVPNPEQPLVAKRALKAKRVLKAQRVERDDNA